MGVLWNRWPVAWSEVIFVLESGKRENSRLVFKGARVSRAPGWIDISPLSLKQKSRGCLGVRGEWRGQFRIDSLNAQCTLVWRSQKCGQLVALSVRLCSREVRNLTGVRYGWEYANGPIEFLLLLHPLLKIGSSACYSLCKALYKWSCQMGGGRS